MPPTSTLGHPKKTLPQTSRLCPHSGAARPALSGQNESRGRAGQRRPGRGLFPFQPRAGGDSGRGHPPSPRRPRGPGQGGRARSGRGPPLPAGAAPAISAAPNKLYPLPASPISTPQHSEGSHRRPPPAAARPPTDEARRGPGRPAGTCQRPCPAAPLPGELTEGAALLEALLRGHGGGDGSASGPAAALRGGGGQLRVPAPAPRHHRRLRRQLTPRVTAGRAPPRRRRRHLECGGAGRDGYPTAPPPAAASSRGGHGCGRLSALPCASPATRCHGRLSPAVAPPQRHTAVAATEGTAMSPARRHTAMATSECRDGVHPQQYMVTAASESPASAHPR